MSKATTALKRRDVKAQAGRISLLLDRSRPETLTIQIVEQIGKSILEGRIPPGVVALITTPRGLTSSLPKYNRPRLRDS